jgi:hypothetical protein
MTGEKAVLAPLFSASSEKPTTSANLSVSCETGRGVVLKPRVFKTKAISKQRASRQILLRIYSDRKEVDRKEVGGYGG